MAAQGASSEGTQTRTQMGFLRRTVDINLVADTMIRCFIPGMFRDIANDA